MKSSERDPGLDEVVLRTNETHDRTEELLVRARSIGQDLLARVENLLGKERAMPEQAVRERQAIGTTLPEGQRKEIFAALVEAQDHRISVADSRIAIAARFDISERQLRAIEEEGIDKNWPPLEA